ncbi:50S ribosomal protein L19, chloroplastic-like [Impatiens glandulifera]|uniref:50S ribosomal protein L19, chloroplastic-like n=1 Tax=Impatiens glandulifera TaxID=253017 RepID=UPI001FB06D09|nr:50S ribosomal protein L19, chloroplastic-like [Impatiens glandulifera]
MHSFSKGFHLATRRLLTSSSSSSCSSIAVDSSPIKRAVLGGLNFTANPDRSELLFPSSLAFLRLFQTRSCSDRTLFETSNNVITHPLAMLYKNPGFLHAETLPIRCFSTGADKPAAPLAEDNTVSLDSVPPRIKFKRPDKMARNIMQILDREAVEQVRNQREIPDIKPGYIIQMKVEVPENKRRVSIVKGIVIARRNAGLNSTFRVRRLVAGVGVESLFPLYSPNIKEIKILDKKKVRRAKLYYLREKMNALKKH